MLTIDPNYRSLPEQVDFLTEKQEDQETINTEVNQFIDDQEFFNNNQEILNTSYSNRIGQVERQTDTNTEDISNLNSEVEAVAGKGGYLIPYNFGTATPTEQQLNDYALSQITNITQPEEIFNGTRVTNLYNNHTWILNNTQDTDPVVFEWVDLGQSLVSIATNSTEGVVKGSADNLKVAVAVDGTMSVNGLETELDSKQDELNTTNVPSGTIVESIGFNANNELVRGASGGSQLYMHNIGYSSAANINITQRFIIISSISTPFTDYTTFKNWLINNDYTSNMKQFIVNKQNYNANSGLSTITINSGFYCSNNFVYRVDYNVKINVDFTAQTANFSLIHSPSVIQENTFSNFMREDNITQL